MMFSDEYRRAQKALNKEYRRLADEAVCLQAKDFTQHLVRDGVIGMRVEIDGSPNEAKLTLVTKAGISKEQV